MKHKRIALKPVTAILKSETNPCMGGLVTKRDLTTREACHILRNIFLLDIDLSLNEACCQEEKNERYDALTQAANDYIKGESSYGDLCEATYCYDDEGLGCPFLCHLNLVAYLQRIGVI